MDKKFHVVIKLCAEEQGKGEKKTPFADMSVEYHDLPYEGLVAVEHAISTALIGLGVHGCIAAGVSEKLKALGVPCNESC